MPLLTHHSSLSWPSLAPPNVSSPSTSCSSPSQRALPPRKVSSRSTRIHASIDEDEDPFPYFITVSPPTSSGLEADDEDDPYEDWSAGIPRSRRPRARSLSPFRLHDDPVAFEVVDAATVAVAATSTPTSTTGMRRWMHRSHSHPTTPRLRPVGLSIDEVPELEALASAASSSSPSSSSPSGVLVVSGTNMESASSPRSTSDSTRRGRGRGRESGGSSRASRPSLRPRLHSDRPRSWREPSWDLWTVLEETAMERVELEDPPISDDDEGVDVVLIEEARPSSSRFRRRRRLMKDARGGEESTDGTAPKKPKKRKLASRHLHMNMNMRYSAPNWVKRIRLW